MKYRRAYEFGASYFFTVVTHGRQPIFGDPKNVSILKDAMRSVIRRYPFELIALVVLPDHLHCIWQMPENDADFSLRWRLIKTRVSKQIGGQSIWQNRFWEHLIRDQDDFDHHFNYIHYNPVKHGYVKQPGEWRNSTFKHFVALGVYPSDWGASPPLIPMGVGRE